MYCILCDIRTRASTCQYVPKHPTYANTWGSPKYPTYANTCEYVTSEVTYSTSEYVVTYFPGAYTALGGYECVLASVLNG